MPPISVFIVDDHSLIRKGIRVALEEAGIQVTGEASSCDQAEALLATSLPDLLLLDLQLPDGCGLDLARRLRQRAPGLPILVLSAHNQENYVNGALELGLQGYILKDEAPDVLPRAIRSALRGEVWLSNAVAHKMAAKAFRDRRLGYGLTRRENDVLRLLVQGQSDAEIAIQLSVTTRSVRIYLRNIYDKLGVHSRVQAATKAIIENIPHEPKIESDKSHDPGRSR